MSNITVKVKVENDERINFLKFDKEKDSITQQVKDFLDSINYKEPNNRDLYALLNPSTSGYMTNFENIQQCN